MKEMKIDPELRDLLPPLADDEYKQLEKNIVDNGFDRNFPIMEWHGFIVDGHNRYSICRKHNIDYTVGTLAYETKEEVMRWMLDIQLGRRNLTPIQRISVAEKHRALFERQAKEKQVLNGGDRRSDEYQKTNVPNLAQPIQKNPNENKTISKLAAIAGVGKETYRMGAKILNSDDEELKQRVMSGETKISAGYKELQNKNKPKVDEVEKKVDSITEKPSEKPASAAPKPEAKRQVENGVILLPEDSKENKIMNDIARQMKSGMIDTTQLSNEKEIISIASLVDESMRSIFDYIFKNIDFEKFSRENFNEIENILLTVKDTIDNKIKIMEEKIAFDETPKQQNAIITRICKSCGKEKKVIDFFGNDTICKECARKKAEKNVNSLHMISTKPTEENMRIYEDVCTSRYAKDYVDQDAELSWLKDMCRDFIDQVNDRFFDLLGAIEKMDNEHIEEANNIFEDFVSEVFEVQKRFNEKKMEQDVKCPPAAEIA